MASESAAGAEIITSFPFKGTLQLEDTKFSCDIFRMGLFQCL